MRWIWILMALMATSILFAQTPDTTATEEEEDWSLYDDLSFADEGAKRFCTSKVTNLSPQKLISVGYDFQGGYDVSAGSFESFAAETATVTASHGLRLQANIPLLSRNDIIVQLNANYAEQRYAYADNQTLTHPLHRWLNDNGLRTMGLGMTVFKPFNEKNFLLVQASGDNNGDFGWADMPSLRNTRYSAAVVYGWKKSDRMMWGLGAARTYRVGEINYVPIVLLNWTSSNGKWGTELLLPARGHLRRTFNSRNLMLFGFELEGNSYRMNNRSDVETLADNIELRRSELRIRLAWERSIKDFIWLSAQAGYRYNWAFEADNFTDNREFFRGFFGDQPYLMENSLTNTFYLLFSVNLVSP